jgi:hypothetical protein
MRRDPSGFFTTEVTGIGEEGFPDPDPNSFDPNSFHLCALCALCGEILPREVLARWPSTWLASPAMEIGPLRERASKLSSRLEILRGHL